MAWLVVLLILLDESSIGLCKKLEMLTISFPLQLPELPTTAVERLVTSVLHGCARALLGEKIASKIQDGSIYFM